MTFDLKNPELLNEFITKTFPESILQGLSDKSKASEIRRTTRELVTADSIDGIFEFAFHKSCLALISRIDTAKEIKSPEPQE